MTINIGYDSTTNKDLFKTLLGKIFNNSLHDALYESDMIFNARNVSDYYERDLRQASVVGMQEISDGQEIPLADPTIGTTKEWTQSRWGLGFRITAGMKKYNKWKVMEENTKSVAVNMKEAKDREIAKMYNNATNTTYASGYDTLALASSSHTTLAGGYTYDNYLDAGLSHAGLESALQYFDNLIDDNGWEIPAVPSKLVVCPEYRLEARELLESELKPYTGDNTKNIYKGVLDWMVYHRANTTTSWSVIAKDNKDYDLHIFTSQEPKMTVKDAPDLTEDTVCICSQWFTYGFGDPRMFYLGDA
jgi:hypothetical protein